MPEPAEVMTESAQRGYGRAQLRLFRSGGERATFPNYSLSRLIDSHLAAAEQRDAQVVLLWPATLGLLPLAHAFATTEHWMRGNKRGLRTLFYPAKANSLYPLNHIFVGRKELRDIAGRFAEVGGINPLITRPFRQKDTLLFKAGGIRELRPCLNELLPRFEWLFPQQAWPNGHGRLLEHVLTKLRRISERAALRTTFLPLGSPETAPDALFTIGYDLDRRECREALKGLFAIGPPDVVLVDATRRVRTTIDRWDKKLEDFHLALGEVMGASRPGVVVITDDGAIAAQLRDRLAKKLERPARAPRSLRVTPVICLEPGDGLSRLGRGEMRPPDPRVFAVHLHDRDASQLTTQLYRTIHKLTLDPVSGAPLRDAASFLSKLSALPAGQETVNGWLDDRQAGIRMRDQFSWMAHKAQVVEFIAQGHAGPHRGELEKTLSAIDSLVRNYNRGTTLALAMAQAVSTATEHSRLAIVLPRPVLRLFAQRFLEQFPFADRPYAELRPHLDLILTSDLERKFAEGSVSRYVFIGLDEHALSMLATGDRLPDGTQVLLTHRSGLYMRWSLRPIVGFDEFAIFRPRIQMLLTQLERQVTIDPHFVMQRDDFLLPSFDFRASVGDSTQAVSADGAEARIDLSGRPPLFRGEGSILYVYEPTHEAAGPGGFRSMEAADLRPGDLLFQLSEDLRELLEDVLQRAGVSLASDRPFEQMLRQYHQCVVRKVAERFPLPTRAAQVTAIRERIKGLHPELVDLPENIGHWVDLGSSPDTPFDELRPHAPRSFAHFRAFAEALGFDQTDVTQFWHFAIQRIRIQRRLDGRYVGDVYANLLFDPESAIVHARLSRSDTDALYDLARENLATVLGVEYPATVPRGES